MNAITEPPVAPPIRPGNLSERQLAATLAKSAPPEEAITDLPTKPADPIPPATLTGEPTPPAVDSVIEPPELPTTEEPPEGGTPNPEDDEPAAEPTEAAEPTKSRLPPELADAMELARGDGKKGVADLLHRVHKLTDQRDTERNARLDSDERLQILEKENAALKVERGTEGAESHQTANVHPGVKGVTDEIVNVDQWLSWCDKNPDGGPIPDGKGGEIELDADGVRIARRGLNNQRSELIARKVHMEGELKAAWQAAYREHHTVAQRLYPELFKKDSPDAKFAQELLQRMPAFKQFPEYEIAVGDYLNGVKLRLAKGKAPTAPRKPAPAREPTPVVTEPPAAQPARASSADKEVKEAEDRYRKSGKTSDLAKLNTAKTRAQRARQR